jgi:hypothetical protein
MDPTRPTTEKIEPVIDEIARLQEAGESVSASQLGNKQGYKGLTQKQNTEMWQRSGQLAYDKLSVMIETSSYQNSPDDVKAKQINEILNKAKLNARVEKVIEVTTDLSEDELNKKLSQLKKAGILTKEVFDQYKKMR